MLPLSLKDSLRVWVPLGQEEVARDWRAEVVLLGELADAKIGPAVAGPGLDGLVEVDLTGLLVQDEHVAVLASSLRRAGADVLGQGLALGEVVARDVADEPVLPLAETGHVAGGSVGVGQGEGVPGVGLSIPAHLGSCVHVRGRHDVAVVYFEVAGVGDVEESRRLEGFQNIWNDAGLRDGLGYLSVWRAILRRTIRRSCRWDPGNNRSKLRGYIELLRFSRLVDVFDRNLL